MTMTVPDLARAIKGLDEADLQELVSHLSSDCLTEKEQLTASTMETMMYAFNTSRVHIQSRREMHTMREQAHLYS